ncbi:AAA family ATPase, partial [Candidatus Sumerlaeota bacterium]|nr:AAA family ATPase [Candidatus Sumerlaeota bacterium]
MTTDNSAVLEDLAAAAPEYQPEHPLPRVLSARDFIAAGRPHLEFHIEGLLPRGGKMTISAPAKFGKSFLAIELGLTLAAGNCEFLGWKFGSPVPVHYLQVEIMDALMEARLRKLLETMPEGIDPDRAADNFFVQEIAETTPDLMNADGRTLAEKVIQRMKPEILIVDPLAFAFPGLEENAAESMGAALRYLTELGARHKCGVILIHHHGNGGTGSRGSSVYEGWPDTDIQATYVDPEIRDVAKVTGRLRCAWGGGPWYWRMPTPDSLWFSPMPDDYEPEGKRGGRPKLVTIELVELVLGNAGRAMRPGDLYDAISTAAGSSTSA